MATRSFKRQAVAAMNYDESRECQLLDLGRASYEDTWELQRKLAATRRDGQGKDTLILVEHESLYTVGRAGSEGNVKVSAEFLQKRGIRVVAVDRGGDITYHGPGQLVGYPILDLRRYGRDVHRYCWMLEEVLIRTLAGYGIAGFRESGLTGVWTAAGKIAALGIGLHNWISWHGFALNIKPDMRYFHWIHPCGITTRKVVSMESLGVVVSSGEVKSQVIQQFGSIFGVNLAKRAEMPTPLPEFA